MNLHQLGEFGLIRHLSGSLATRPGVKLGIGDDAALLDALSAPIVTCDCLVEGVHFRRDWTTPYLLGRKALNVNVSDVAAMGGRCVAAFVTLALGPDVELTWVEELYRGLESAAAEAGCTIAGGDTSRASQTFLSITLLGDAPSPVLRSGARVGDVLVVTGTLGDSAAGLALLQQGQKGSQDADESLVLARHFDPMPRGREMNAALEVAASGNVQDEGARAVSAALDLSDGLAGDARHIAARSEVSLEIEVAKLPLSSGARAVAERLATDPVAWALRGGEDYELLLCVAPQAVAQLTQYVTTATGTPMTVVGRCVPREAAPVILLYPEGRREVAEGAWEHF